jgi:hypothetical protein
VLSSLERLRWDLPLMRAGVLSATLIKIFMAQVHAWRAEWHSQNLCKTVSLAPTRQTGQYCTTSTDILPRQALTAIDQCQVTHIKLASLRSQSLSHTVFHLSLYDGYNTPLYFLSTTDGTTCLLLSKLRPKLAVKFMK